MDKRDLLRSFSKVHNRSLSCLNEVILDPTEAIDQRTKEAESLLKSAAWAPLNPNNPQGTQTAQVGNATVNWNSKSNKVSNNSGEAYYDPKSGTVSQIPGKSEKRFKSFISSIIPYETPNDMKPLDKQKLNDDPSIEGPSKKKREAGITLADKIMSFVGATQEIAASIQQSFSNIANLIAQDSNGTFAQLARSMGTTVERLANYFTGGLQQSLESRLSNLSFKLVSKDGSLVKVKSTPDAASRKKVAEKLENLMSIALGEKQSASSPECKALTKNFAMTGGRGNRSIVIAVDSNINDNDSLALSDNQGIYEEFLKTAYKKCGKRKDPEEIRLSSDSTGGANANRGFAFEEVPQLLNLVNAINEAKTEAEKKCLRDQLKKASDKLFEKLNKLSEDTEGWVASEANTALTIEDQASLDMAKSLVATVGNSKSKQEFNTKLVRAMIPYGQNIQNRGSIMALPAGEDTGQGKRQDVLEVFEDCDKAREGLARTGSELGVEPQTMKISELSKAQQESLKCFQKGDNAKLPSDKDAEVCVVNTSLKNYRGISTGITTGSQRGGSQGETADIVMEYLDGTLNTDQELSPEDIKEVEDLQKELQELRDKRKQQTAGTMASRDPDESKKKSLSKRIKNILNKVDPRKLLAGRVVKAEEKYKELLGFSDEQHRRAAEVLKEQSDINNFIINNPEADVILPNGKVLNNYDVFNTVGEIAIDKLTDMLEIGQESPEAEELRQLIQEHRDEPSEKARRKVATFIEKQSLMMRIKRGDQDALNALKLKMMRVGGDSTDVLGLEIRDIDNNKTYGFKHNQPLQDAFENLGQPDSEWQIDGGSPGSSDITLVHPTLGKIKLEARVVRTDSGFTTQYSVHYSKQIIEAYNKYNTPQSDNPVIEAINLISKTLHVLREKVTVRNMNQVT